jgi:NADH-ubiquinone oxidoreductase chain 2
MINLTQVIQLISQIKGYFYINPTLGLSLGITLFSFAGIPPLVGFFAKLMVLSAALQNGLVFLALIAVITSVISAVYYLNVVKDMFFEKEASKLKRDLFFVGASQASIDNFLNIEEHSKRDANNLLNRSNLLEKKYTYFSLTNALSIPISILTLSIVLFMFTPDQILHMSNLLSLILFSSSI